MRGREWEKEAGTKGALGHLLRKAGEFLLLLN